MRLRIDFSYDGSGFHGWAIQPGLRTVQGELEAALERVLRSGSTTRTTVAGRTDACVHAKGQVVHVDVPRAAFAGLAPRLSANKPAARASDAAPAGSGDVLVRRLNAVLPAEIRVRAAASAAAGFDARFSAISRCYKDRMADDPLDFDPLTRGSVLWYRHQLDVSVMAAAAQLVTGEHDFIAFSRPRPGASTVRRVIETQVKRLPGAVIEFTIEADAFTHSMVRSLAGA